MSQRFLRQMLHVEEARRGKTRERSDALFHGISRKICAVCSYRPRPLSCSLNFIGFLRFQSSLFYRSLFRFLLRHACIGDVTIRVTGNEPEVRKGLNATFDLEERISFFAATFARRQMRERNSRSERESEWMSTRMRGGLIR